MRGLPLRVIADHTPSERAAIQVRAGERVAVGRYDRDPDGWPAFRFVTTTGGAEGWVVDRFLGVARDRDRDAGEVVDDVEVLGDYDTTELAAHAGDVVRAEQEDGLWVWCAADDGRAGWLPLAACTLDPRGLTPAVPRGPVPIVAIPPQLFVSEWIDGAPYVGRPEPDGTGHRGYPLRDTPGLTLDDYRASPTASRRHELHRGTFVFPPRERLDVNELRGRLGLELFRWTEEHGGRCGINGPASTLGDDVVWPWLAVQGPGHHDPGDRALHGPPDLAVEVVDAEDPYQADRLALLAEHATPGIWLLDPWTGEVEVRTVAGATRRVDGAASLRCEVLPGLAVEPAQRTVRR